MISDYEFFFVGGTCGCFVKAIFSYYVNKINHTRPILAKINPITGDCHNSREIMHCHHIDQLDLTKKLIVIDFDEEDKPSIVNMSFHKAMWPEICENPNKIKEYCGGQVSHIAPTDFDLLKKTVTQNPDLLIFFDWKDQLAKLNPVLILNFKDIVFGNLNQLLADFFQVAPLPEIDNYIIEYRNINQKYLIKLAQEKLEWK
jgi:hypothetical protein